MSSGRAPSAFVVAAATFALGCGGHRDEPRPAPPVLRWVGVARQQGVVGYRDPPAAISPDGARIAYGEGRSLRVRPTSGGPLEALPPLPAQLRAIAWHPSGERLLVETTKKPRRYWLVDRRALTVAPFFGDRDVVEGDDVEHGARFSAREDELAAPAWSPSGRVVAFAVQRPDGAEIWRLRTPTDRASVQRVAGRVSSLAFAPSGELACVVEDASRRRRVELKCGGPPLATQPDVDWFGPLAFAPDGATLYAATPRAAAASFERTLDLVAIDVATGRTRALTSFDRDTYAPSVAADGAVLARLSSYHTSVALVAAEGGAPRPLTTFQSETPYWHPSGDRLSVTFGKWRRQVQDVDYPDIDQRVGVVPVGAALVDHADELAPHVGSEDQAGAWSPNGRWFSYHSHRDGSDDLWLERADDRGGGRRLTFFSRGAETYWPRWSPDGRAIAFATTSKKTGRHAPHLVGVDPESGATTSEAREIEGLALDADVVDLAFTPKGDALVALAHVGPGQQAIVTFPMSGGPARVVRRIASEHINAGFALSPDGAEVVFVAPAPDGFVQLFRAPLEGGEPRQITSDPSDKTQPAWSPDGKTIALTVWRYDAALFVLRP
jgi:Tol biopolymer transport system component